MDPGGPGGLDAKFSDKMQFWSGTLEKGELIPRIPLEGRFIVSKWFG